METDCRWMQHNDHLGKQPAENQMSRSITEPLLFIAGLLGRTAMAAVLHIKLNSWPSLPCGRTNTPRGA